MQTKHHASLEGKPHGSCRSKRADVAHRLGPKAWPPQAPSEGRQGSAGHRLCLIRR